LRTFLAPLRLSLAGGGTDVSPFADENGSSILNFAIDKHVRVEIIEESVGSLGCAVEIVIKGNDGTVQARDDFAINLEKAFTNSLKTTKKFKVIVTNPVKPSSGLGTSSTMISSVLKALKICSNNHSDNLDIIKESLIIERIEMGILGGFQDSFPALYGGINYIDYLSKTGTWEVQNLRTSRGFTKLIEDSIFTFELGVQRNSHKVIADQIDRSKDKNSMTYKALVNQREIAREMKRAFEAEDFEKVLDLIDKSFELKKEFTPLISSERIQSIENTLRSMGARGIKVSGAGGGGHMFCFFPQGKPNGLVNQLPDSITPMKCAIEFTGFKEIN
jgi:D-glycero-alpha-D-manno-heptose-7-phosphate kinase